MRPHALSSDNEGPDFFRIIRPGKTPLHWGQGTRLFDVFCKIEYKDGKLSISGVEGPMENGNARGSCGQIDMSADGGKLIQPAPGWTRDMLRKFFATWKEWHLNDMTACCEHQTAAGWRAIACEEVTLYNWQLTDAASAAKRAAKDRAMQSLQSGKPHLPTDEEAAFAVLPYEVTTSDAVAPPNYQAKRPLASHHAPRATETKALGRLKPEEHPRGILCKPCDVCGYKYGTAWNKRAVPADVLEFLRTLPVADKTPAWV